VENVGHRTGLTAQSLLYKQYVKKIYTGKKYANITRVLDTEFFFCLYLQFPNIYIIILHDSNIGKVQKKSMEILITEKLTEKPH
jgi:hypothetical protein